MKIKWFEVEVKGSELSGLYLQGMFDDLDNDVTVSFTAGLIGYTTDIQAFARDADGDMGDKINVPAEQSKLYEKAIEKAKRRVFDALNDVLSSYEDEISEVR